MRGSLQLLTPTGKTASSCSAYVEESPVDEVEEPADHIAPSGQVDGEPRLSFRLSVDVRERLLEERTERACVVVRRR
jgi:hypothetical protein